MLVSISAGNAVQLIIVDQQFVRNARRRACSEPLIKTRVADSETWLNPCGSGQRHDPDVSGEHKGYVRTEKGAMGGGRFVRSGRPWSKNSASH